MVVAAAIIPWTSIALQGVAVAQENPYGKVDTSKANISLLRTMVGTDGTPMAVSVFDRLDPAEADRLFEALLDHDLPAMRTLAGVALVKRGADPRRIAERMDSEDATGAMMLGTLVAKRLERDDAIALVDDELAMPTVARTIILARAGRSSDAAALASIAEDPNAPRLARGLAAAALEQDSPGRVRTWLRAMDEDPTVDRNQRDRTVFEVIETIRALGLVRGLQAIEELIQDREANDGLRAACVLALLQVDPSLGLEAWNRLNASDDASASMIPIAMLLVAGDVRGPSAQTEALPTLDPLQQDIKALVLADPTDRPKVAINAIRRGHVPTMRWFLELPDDRMSVDSLEALIERGTRSRRAVMVELLTDAAEAMARVAPERLVEPLKQAQSRNDFALVEIILRGLIAAGDEPAAEAAKPALQASRKATTSLALLAIASGSDLDDASQRKLARIAAGGGDLPRDLRPIAAWHHLRLNDKIDESLPQIMAP